MRKIEAEEFFTRIKENGIFEKYDFSKSNFKSLREKITVICPEHGEFSITPSQLILNHGCLKCANSIKGKKRTSNSNDFIKKAKLVHGDFYDYSKVNYKSSSSKIKIICPIHLIEFEQTPNNHLRGNKCPKCALENISTAQRLTKEDFLNRCSEKYGDYFDYSNVNYINSQTKVKITCPEHGLFEVLPLSFINGLIGCNKCAINYKAQKNTLTREELIERFNKKYDNKYIYQLEPFTRNDLIQITCPEHGSFQILASSHLLGCECPKCNDKTSKGEVELLEYIKQFDKNVISNDKSILNPFELDIYCPTRSLAFEFNGLYWHSEKIGKDKKYHLNKTNECLKQGIQLIHIFEDEWIYKKQIVKSRIKHLLGKTSYKIYGRKCIVKEIDSKLANKFLEKYHIQGNCSASIKLGLFYKNRLVAVMTLGKSRFNKNYDFELLRYCTVGNFTIIGGASKLLAYFRKNYPGSLVSYADKRWSTGNLYKQLGFKELKDSSPNYFYFKGDKRFSRVMFQKHKLKNRLEVFDENLTEKENMVNNGYNCIWDCGNKIFVLK